jgi:hypothetical protein
VSNKCITAREWRIAVLEMELKNCEELLTTHKHQLEEHEVEYFKEYRDKLQQDILEECLLTMEPEDE